jgi:O-antigen/teichoic acid export membrane protein
MQIVLFNQYTSTILVAHFFIVTKFYEIIRVAVSNFSQVLYPKIIQMEASQNWVGIRKMYFSSIMKAFFLTAIIALIIINFGDFVFIKWSKLSDEATLQLFHYYLFFILLVIIDNVSVIYLAALKLNAVPTIVSFCQGILSVVFTYLLINKYGLMGAFYASIASFIITNMLFNPMYLLQKIKVRSYNPIA